MQLRKDQSILLIAGVLSLAIWLLPLLRPILLPLQYYNTHVHELAHALATVLTGGAVEYVSVFANGGGVTLSAGGFGPLIASAGYVGSAIVEECCCWDRGIRKGPKPCFMRPQRF